MQSRLYEITMLLVGRGRATATELAEKFDVSVRTIYRDIDALSAAGVPVYTEPGRGGGIRLLEGYVLDKSLFSADEQSQLMAHSQSVAALGAPGADALLDKLAALFGQREAWLQVDFAPWDGGDEARKAFGQLRDAILRRHVVTFDYAAAGGSQGRRQVEPYRVIFRGQGWYLYGFSRERDDFRFFKLQRMRNLSMKAEVFAPRDLPKSPMDAPYNGEVTQLKLWISQRAAFRVYDEFGEVNATKTPEGDFVVQMRYPSSNWLVGYVLSFGADAKVLEPEDLRKTVAEMAMRLAELYNK